MATITAASITAGQLPPGLSIGVTGGIARISGTPTTNGTFNFTISVTEASGVIITKVFQLIIGSSTPPPPPPSNSAFALDIGGAVYTTPENSILIF